MYLRPRDSAPDKIAFALASDESKRSLVIRAVSATVCSAAATERDSRCCAVLIKLIAVSPARISNSSLLKLVMSRRERKSANWVSSWRIRSTAFSVGAATVSSLNPTQERNFFSAIFHSSNALVHFGKPITGGRVSAMSEFPRQRDTTALRLVG